MLVALGLGRRTDSRRSQWHLLPRERTLSMVHSGCNNHDLGEEGRDAVTVDGGGWRRGHEGRMFGRAGK